MENFHDQEGWIWCDGKLRKWNEVQLHVLSHGLHYASCVFEGERVYGGTVFKLREHSQRLIESARMLGFEIPYTVEEIDRATIETAKAMKCVDGYVRPVAWRGSEQMGVSAQKTKVHLAIAVWDWPSYFSPEARERGIKLTMSKWKRPSPETEPVKAKASGLYMICTLSKEAAEKAGFDDALMLDWRGQVAECTGANVLLVMNGEIHTPTPDCFLDGITRRAVIGLAKGRGIKVIERAVWPDDLKTADEVFVTGTAAEVTPIGQIDDLHFQVGPITRKLRDDFEKLVRQPAKQTAKVG